MPGPETVPGLRNIEPEGTQPPITSRKPARHSTGMDFSVVGQESHPVAGIPTERRSIIATDFKKLEIPEGRTICYCCGRKGAWYVEKLTTDRKARPKDQQDARRVCKFCYNAAVQKKRTESPPLPGTISLAMMQRISSSVGRCSVCELAPAVYLDRETGVRLCEPCYSREAMQQTQRLASVSPPGEIVPLFDELIRNGRRGTPGAAAICARLLEGLLLKVAEARAPLPGQETLAFATYQHCREHLQRNFLRLRSVAQVAEECHLDDTYLCRLFQRYDHESPYRLLVRLKMNQAAERLQLPGAMVKQVAEEAGFANQFHFSRVFKSVFGIPPRAMIRLR